jgi:hypothetical protein
MCEPIGNGVNSDHEGATGRVRKDTPLGRERWNELKSGQYVGWSNQEGVSNFSLEKARSSKIFVSYY